MAKSNRARISAFVGITLLSTLLSVAAVQTFPFLAIMGRWVADVRIANLTPPQPQHPEIVVAAITEDTLKRFPYRSPVDRAFLADLLKTLEAKGARAIGIDLLFDQPTEPEKDAGLRETLRDLEPPVVAAYADRRDGLDAEQVAYLRDFVAPDMRAYANLAKDPFDGTARRIYPGRKDENGRFVPGIVGALAEDLGLSAPDSEVPIAWRGRPEGGRRAFRMFPAHAIRVIPPAMLKDKVVLVGADLTLTDLHRTPFAAAFGAEKESLTPGVLVHAHGLAQLMDGLQPRYPGIKAEIGLVFVFTLVAVGLSMLAESLWLRILLMAGFVIAFWIGGFAVYRQALILVPLITPTIAVATSMWVVEVYFGRQHRQEKRLIRGAFAQYMSPQLVEQVVADPKLLKVGGEHREMSFLFTDIAGFTSMTESVSPELLTQILNAYLDQACGIVMSHGGFIDKIVGDAVVAIFNAPVDQPDHAERAVACALELDAFGENFRRSQVGAGVPFGVTRIGVNTGTAVVGNFGGNARFDYTAHGDAMNTAARLESVNKHLGTRICIAGATVDQCSATRFRPVGDLVLKGKTEGIAAFQPIPENLAGSPQIEKYLRVFELMTSRAAEAGRELKALLAEHPEDSLVRFHVARYERGEEGTTIIMKEK